jgi:hypothetical protein
MRKARPAALMHSKDSRLIRSATWRTISTGWPMRLDRGSGGGEPQDQAGAVQARGKGPQARTAVVSSNTSGIPLKSMSEGLSEGFKQHFLGTHFFNPVRYMKLLEIIPGEETLPEVLDFMADFGERKLGKGIVWAKDTPNFIGNRIGVQSIGAPCS